MSFNDNIYHQGILFKLPGSDVVVFFFFDIRSHGPQVNGNVTIVTEFSNFRF